MSVASKVALLRRAWATARARYGDLRDGRMRARITARKYVDPGWAYIASEAADLPLRDRLGAIDPNDREAIRIRVRDVLANIFAPLASDLHFALAARAAEPPSALPRAGTAPTRSEYGPVLRRLVMLRPDLASKFRLLTFASARYHSVQHVAGHPHSQGLDMATPIGAYGPRLARAIVEASRIVYAIAQEVLPSPAATLTAKYARVLSSWTFQRSALAALLEGLNTFGNATALLTYHAVPGLEALDLLAWIDRSHLFDRLAKAPPDVVGPMVAYGVLPRRCVRFERRADGERLVLSIELDTILRGARYVTSPLILNQALTQPTHKGCPLAVRNLTAPAPEGDPWTNRETYIETLGRHYLRLVSALYRGDESA